MDHTLTVRSISHSYGKKKVLSAISFSCQTGDVLGIFGRNGTGKSTLLKILFGTVRPTEMDLLLNGKQATAKTSLNQYFAYHHQEVFLPMNMLVRNLVPLYFPGDQEQNSIFYEPGLNKMENRRVGTLSMGEQRYLQFILLLHLDQPFLLLDEPFSMIEPLYKELIMDKIENCRPKKGFIITDHYYRDVLKAATVTKLIRDGVMVDVHGEQHLAELGYLSRENMRP